MAKTMSRAEYRKLACVHTNDPMDMETMRKIAVAKFVPESHHEAAHAATAWLMGYGENITFIAMDVERSGVVYGGTGVQAHMLKMCCERVPGPFVKTLRVMRRGFMFMKLSGGAAVAKMEGETGWCEGLFDWAELEGWLENPQENNNDVAWAWNLAMADTRSSYGRAYQLLMEMAGWVDELLALPRVWRLVTDVAGILKPNRRTPGSKVRSALMKAWGSSPPLPILELGSPWLERLGFPSSAVARVAKATGSPQSRNRKPAKPVRGVKVKRKGSVR